MPEYITDNDGKWEVNGKRGRVILLVEPSQAWIDARAAEAAAAAQAAAQVEAELEAGLQFLSTPLVDEVEKLLTQRGLSVLDAAERSAVTDATVYLSSRGQFGKPA